MSASLIPTSEKTLINTLKQGDNAAFAFVYKNYWPMISRFVRSNKGTREEAEELYQQGIVTLFEKLKNNDFVLTCSIRTFLYSICKNKWLNLLKEKRRRVCLEEHDEAEQDSVDGVPEFPDEAVIRNAIAALGNPCCQLLTGFYYEKLSLATLASQLNYTSPNVAKQQKCRCVERLRKLLFNKGNL